MIINTPSSSTVTGGTREQIIHAAQRMIEKRSYLGFSFQDIADEIGIRKASLYHHFPSKEALGEEVIREATRKFSEWTDGMHYSAEKKLKAYFLMYRNTLHAGEGICPAGALAPGWDCISDDLRNAVRDLRSTQVKWLTGLMEELKPAEKQPARLAAYIFSVCQGGLVAARMTEDVADFDDTLTLLKNSLIDNHK